MKKGYIVTLAVIFGFALVMGCAHEAIQKEKGKSKYMKIKVEVDNGQTVEVKGENDVDPEEMGGQELDPQQLEQMYQGLSGFKYVGIVLYSHSSPGCAIYCSGGKCYRICH